MVKILTYNQIDRQKWYELVQSSPVATWFQTDEAYRFYSSLHGELQPFAHGVAENDRLVGVVVGFITSLSVGIIGGNYTCRAIIYGGPLLSEDISEEALNTLLKEVMKVRINIFYYMENPGWIPPPKTPIYIETRNFHDYSKWKTIFEQNGFAYQPHYDIHVHCDANHQISERRQRELKKAIKNGAVVQEAQSEQEVREWYQILSQLYRTKVRTPLFSEDFFLQFYRNRVGKYLLVKKDNKVIGGMMCPILEGKAIYEWYVCGLDEQYRELSPSVVATNAAIEYAKAHNLPLFDFMGAGEPDVPYGVRDFKMEFGGELQEYGRFLCIRKPLLYKIGTFGVKWLKRK